MNAEPSGQDLIYRDHPPVRRLDQPLVRRGVDWSILKEPLSGHTPEPGYRHPGIISTVLLLLAAIVVVAVKVIIFLVKAALCIAACLFVPVVLILLVLVPSVAVVHIASFGTPAVLLLAITWYLFRDKST